MLKKTLKLSLITICLFLIAFLASHILAQAEPELISTNETTEIKTSFVLEQFIALPEGGVNKAQFSPEKNFLLVSINNQQAFYLKLFSMAELNEILNKEIPGPASGLSVSNKGYFIAYTSQEAQKTAVFSQTGRQVIPGNLASTAVALSPSGDALAIGTEDNQIHLIKLPLGSLLWQKELNGQVKSILFFQEKTKILVGADTGLVYQIDRKNAQIDWQTQISKPAVEQLSISAVQEIILADKTLLNTQGEVIDNIPVQQAIIFDENHFVLAQNNKLSVVNKKGKELWQCPPQEDISKINFIDIAADGSKIITAGCQNQECSKGFIAVFKGQFGNEKDDAIEPPQTKPWQIKIIDFLKQILALLKKPFLWLKNQF